MTNRARVWGSMIVAMLLVIIFDITSHMWGPGVYDWSPAHHLSNTVEALRSWIRIVGLPLVAFLLYIERRGNPIGKYWILYPIVRVFYDVGWMVYWHNPYPSWYVQDFGAFLVCMAPAFAIDTWGSSPSAIQTQRAGSEARTGHDWVKLLISIISLATALIGLIKALTQ